MHPRFLLHSHLPARRRLPPPPAPPPTAARCRHRAPTAGQRESGGGVSGVSPAVVQRAVADAPPLPPPPPPCSGGLLGMGQWRQRAACARARHFWLPLPSLAARRRFHLAPQVVGRGEGAGLCPPHQCPRASHSSRSLAVSRWYPDSLLRTKPLRYPHQPQGAISTSAPAVASACPAGPRPWAAPGALARPVANADHRSLPRPFALRLLAVGGKGRRGARCHTSLALLCRRPHPYCCLWLILSLYLGGIVCPGLPLAFVVASSGCGAGSGRLTWSGWGGWRCPTFLCLRGARVREASSTSPHPLERWRSLCSPRLYSLTLLFSSAQWCGPLTPPHPFRATSARPSFSQFLGGPARLTGPAA